MPRLLGLILAFTFACVLLAPLPAPPATAVPTDTPSPTPSPTHILFPTPTRYPTAWPTATPLPPDTGWQLLRPGLEVRRIALATGDLSEPVVITRVDPTILRIRVHYDPSEPKVISEWGENLHPLLVLNGAYFTPDYQTTGLLVSDGVKHGASYGDFAGMLVVTTDGNTSVRWLGEQPYNPDEAIAQALQSFPMLVKPGGTLGFPANADDGQPARRTAVAQDRQGNILFIIAPRGTLSLYALSRFLTESDLAIDIAVNLDGGTSSGLWLRTDALSLDIDSLVPVPSAITVEEQ